VFKVGTFPTYECEYLLEWFVPFSLLSSYILKRFAQAVHEDIE